MTLKRCHHHGFTVSDLDRAVGYYRDLLGLELIRISQRKNLPSYDRILGYDHVELKVALLRHPATGFLLELFQYVSPPVEKRDLANHRVGASHVAFEVDDVDAIYDRLRRHGYGAIHAPVDVERDGKIVARAMYALDPDGISIEMFEERGDIVSR